MIRYAVFSRLIKGHANGTARGCCYRFLVLDPMSVAAAELDRREGGGQQAQGRIRRALSQFQLMQEQNAGKKGSVEVRICTNAPRVSIVRSDNELLVTQYVPPLLGDSSFTFHLQNVPGGIFSQYLQHFEAVWNGAQAPNTVTD